MALTGAGISAESGIPTFREAQTGLWSKYRPEELATPQAFHRHPALVWKWYAWRRQIAAEATPNRGHVALVGLEDYYRKKGCNFSLITQNVDGLHTKAGNHDIIELHGNIQRVKCFDSNHIIPYQDWSTQTAVPPTCPRCGSPLRPDVVWFGENLPRKVLDQAWQAAQECQIFLSIGTSSLVEPAASLAHIAHRRGALVIEINLDTTTLTAQADYLLHGKAGEILPELFAAFVNQQSGQEFTEGV